MANAPWEEGADLGSEVAGRWVNDGGSVLAVKVTSTGQIYGALRLAGDGFSYKPYRVLGTYLLRPEGEHGIVASVLGWPRPSSITVWCGQLSDGLDELSTRWLMASGPDGSLDWDDAIGGAMFRRARPTGPGH